MKKIVFAVAFLVWIPFVAFGQDITGTWNGELNIQTVKLKLVFHIQKTVNGYNATMDSPNQGAKGIQATSVSFKNRTLKIVVANIGLSYEGTLSAEGEIITGKFKQNTLELPLKLMKGAPEKKSRPQEPVRPYSYLEEEITFENPFAEGVKLAATLTLPKKDGRFPAAILISGSGAQNRNEELMGHKPFLVLADHLTRNGIAVLRYDDRGTAASTGNFQTATSSDFSMDAESAFKYLQTRKEINPEKIGLIGHSEGGIVASMLAARRRDVAFIALLAGTGVRGDKLLLLQQELICRSSGVDEKTLQNILSINRKVFEIASQSPRPEQLKIELVDFLKKVVAKNPGAKPQNMSEDEFINAQVNQLTSPWMLHFLKYDPALSLEQVQCPVLALNGERDLQVPAKVNLESIRNAVAKGGNKNVLIRELPGLNHLFQTCKTGLPSEYGEIEETISPITLKLLSDFINSLN